MHGEVPTKLHDPDFASEVGGDVAEVLACAMRKVPHGFDLHQTLRITFNTYVPAPLSPAGARAVERNGDEQLGQLPDVRPDQSTSREPACARDPTAERGNLRALDPPLVDFNR